MNRKAKSAAVAVLAAAMGMSSVGCETKAQTGALVGAGGGALLGGAIGSLSHSRAGAGAAIGAGVGALGGYVVGNEMDKKDQKTRDASAARSTRTARSDDSQSPPPRNTAESAPWTSGSSSAEFGRGTALLRRGSPSCRP